MDKISWKMSFSKKKKFHWKNIVYIYIYIFPVICVYVCVHLSNPKVTSWIQQTVTCRIGLNSVFFFLDLKYQILWVKNWVRSLLKSLARRPLLPGFERGSSIPFSLKITVVHPFDTISTRELYFEKLPRSSKTLYSYVYINRRLFDGARF